MNEIKCPKCGNVFSVDEADYASIANQIRNNEFNEELARRTAEQEKRFTIKQELELNKKELEFRKILEKKEQEISRLGTEVARNDSLRKMAVLETENSFREKLQAKDTEIAELKGKMTSEKDAAIIREKSLADKGTGDKAFCRTDKPHRMDCKTLGIDIEAHGVIDQHHRYEQKEQNKNAGNKTYTLQIGIEQLDKGLLVHNILHRRIPEQSLLYDRKTVSGNIVSRYLQFQRDRNRIDLEHIHEILPEYLFHLLHSLLLCYNIYILHITCLFQLVCKSGRICLIRLHGKDCRNRNILLEIIGHRTGVDYKNARHTHQEKYQTDTDHR